MVPVSKTDRAVGISLPAAVPLDTLNANALGRKELKVEADAKNSITAKEAVVIVNIKTYADLLRIDIKIC